MEAATEIIGPVVRMCDDPDCGGLNACDRIAPSQPIMAITVWVEPGRFPDEALLELLVHDLILACCSDSSGAMHMIPDRTEFTVHKGDRGIEEQRRVPGRDAATAVYSGPARHKDDIVADAPLASFEDSSFAYRLQQARNAGRFDVAAQYVNIAEFSRDEGRWGK